MLVAPRQLDHLRHFGLSHLEGINAADADPVPVDVQHNLNRLFAGLGKESLQNMNDKLHGSIVVIENEDLI